MWTAKALMGTAKLSESSRHTTALYFMRIVASQLGQQYNTATRCMVYT